MGCERVPPGPLPGMPAPKRIDPQQRSGDVRPATAGCLASTNMPNGCDTYHPLVPEKFLEPEPAYPRTHSVILDGGDDLFTQVFGLGLAEVLADNALDVSREGKGWLVIVTYWCPIVPTD